MKNLTKSVLSFILLIFAVNKYVVLPVCGIVSCELFLAPSGSTIFNNCSFCWPSKYKFPADASESIKFSKNGLAELFWISVVRSNYVIGFSTS